MVQHCQCISRSEQWYSTRQTGEVEHWLDICRSEHSGAYTALVRISARANSGAELARISAGVKSGTTLDRPERYSTVRISTGVESGTIPIGYQQEWIVQRSKGKDISRR